AQALDTPEFLGVDVEQIARAGMLVAHDRFSWKQVRELGDASSLEHPTHRGHRDSYALGNARLDEHSAPQLHDQQRLLGTDRARAPARPAGAIHQARLTFGQEAAEPLARRGDADPLLSAGQRRVEVLVEDASDELHSTGKGQSGILVGVHSAELLEGLGWVAPPSLPVSVRMNKNNVLEHHS